MENHVVIMAGGIGSRLWPLSTPEMPKQFIDVLGVGKSLIQMTVDRFLPVCDMKNFWVVTSCRYTDMVAEQLPGIPKSHILSEPEPRNTAPCIAYACWKISSECPDANIVVTPSDALVTEVELFAEVIGKALEFTAGGNRIVTVGINPDRPETGYGYINSNETVLNKVVKVKSFKEKPNLETAMSYLAEGGYFWNAGIFVWKAETIISQMKKFVPQIAGIMDMMAVSFGKPDEKSVLDELFPKCEKISIDYAVMEKSEDIYMISENLGWTDLGSWGSVKAQLNSDADGNSAVGNDIRFFGCHNCIVHAQNCGTVIVEGLDGCIVAQKGDKMLVCHLSEEQKIKDYSAPR